jgi:hypothetical protein
MSTNATNLSVKVLMMYNYGKLDLKEQVWFSPNEFLKFTLQNSIIAEDPLPLIFTAPDCPWKELPL